MDFNEYQRAARDTDLYVIDDEHNAPAREQILYMALGVAGEAGEIADSVKKWIRGDFDSQELRKRILKEVGDELWYLSRLCAKLGVPLNYVASQNIEKLHDRLERDVLRGDGDDR